MLPEAEGEKIQHGSASRTHKKNTSRPHHIPQHPTPNADSVTMTRWLVKTGLLMLPAITTSLHLTSHITPPIELSRRSAVSLLITSSSAAAPLFASASADAAKTNVVGQVLLNSKNKKAFPLASFGLQIYDDNTAFRLTLMALEAGYRNFFASVLAGNQKGFAKVSSLFMLCIEWGNVFLTYIFVHRYRR